MGPTLAGARWQMGWTAVAHELSGLAIASHQQSGFGLRGGSDFIVGGEASRAVRVVSAVAEADDERTGDETVKECNEQQQRKEIEGHEGDRTRIEADQAASVLSSVATASARLHARLCRAAGACRYVRRSK
jgi:hypothetical protein